MRVASLGSGIGGADIGWLLGGHEVVARAESDPYRRSVLRARFSADVAGRIADLGRGAPAADAFYLDLPGTPEGGISAWAEAVAVIGAALPAWVLVEHSPARPCGRLVRDLALLGYDLQLLHLVIRVMTPSLAPEAQDVRRRALLLASSPAELARIDLRLTTIDLVADVGPLAGRSAEEAEEQSRMLPRGWTCMCGDDPCQCGARRRQAIREATVPVTTLWLGDLLRLGYQAAHPGGKYYRHLQPAEAVLCAPSA